MGLDYYSGEDWAGISRASFFFLFFLRFFLCLILLVPDVAGAPSSSVATWSTAPEAVESICLSFESELGSTILASSFEAAAAAAAAAALSFLAFFLFFLPAVADWDPCAC